MSIQNDSHDKFEKLCDYLKSLGSCAIAFSGGVDSAFLLKTAHDLLGKNIVAITVKTAFLSEAESNEAVSLCKSLDVEHVQLDVDVLSDSEICSNPKNRCYICKKKIFNMIIAEAKRRNLSCVCDGSNIDDTGDYRPGLKALSELGIKSPLMECGLHKADIRELSKEAELRTWNKPSLACLASRIPYGEEITARKLGMIEHAEAFLLGLGFSQFRVRLHGENLARIEVLPSELQSLFAYREEIVQEFRNAGFSYISLDLQGYRTGSLNEVI